MKNLFFRQINLVLAVAPLLLAGCVASAPHVTTQPVVSSAPSPVTGLPILTTNNVTVTNLVYETSPTLAVVSSNVQTAVATYGPLVSALYPPAAPAVPLAQDVLAGVFGLIAVVSGWIAKKKNDDANTQSQVAAAAVSHIAAVAPATMPALLANTTDATGAATALTAATQAHITQQTI